MLTAVTTIKTIGLIACASIFFSFGFLAGHLDINDKFSTLQMGSFGPPPLPEMGLEHLLESMDIPATEKETLRSLGWTLLAAMATEFRSVVNDTNFNKTVASVPSSCLKNWANSVDRERRLNPEIYRRLEMTGLDCVRAMYETISSSYSEWNLDAAQAKVWGKYVYRQKEADADLRWQSGVLLEELNHVLRARYIEIPPDQLHLGPNPEEILILSASDASDVGDDDTALFMRQALENRQVYADYHGYKHVFLNLSRYESADFEHPCWLKLPAIQETLHKYPEVKWLWWLDMDAIIMNGALKLETHLLHPYVIEQKQLYDVAVSDIWDIYSTGGKTPQRGDVDPENIEFIFTHDYLTINAGSFFMKNTPANILTLDLWGDPEFIYNELHKKKFDRREQDAFIKLYLRHRNVRDRTALYPQSAMNSYDYSNVRAYQRAEDGDFIIHFAGFSNNPAYPTMWRRAWNRRILPDGTAPVPIDES